MTLIVAAGIGVLFNDSANIPVDGVTAALLTNPMGGTLTAFNADGSFTYVPNPDFNGVDSSGGGNGPESAEQNPRNERREKGMCHGAFSLRP